MAAGNIRFPWDGRGASHHVAWGGRALSETGVRLPPPSYHTKPVVSSMQKKILQKRGIGTAAVLLAFISISFASPLIAANSSTPSYSFDLAGPNTALATVGPFAGDTIRLTGSGSFDPSASSVTASGSFTHYCAICGGIVRGTWSATSFNSFQAFGGPSAGVQGGVLVVTVTLYPDGGSPHPGAVLQLVRLVGDSSGAPASGLSIPNFGFTQPTSGRVFFHVSN